MEDADPADRIILGEGVDLAFVRLLQSLRPVDRIVLVLADVVGMSHQEIADAVGSTPAATRQRLRRARAALASPSEDSPAPPGLQTSRTCILWPLP
ncbi:sigma factor-like helix-turn-helix DNA-binding protein [Corynebacterium glyciniphilum]|uniref:sigma factor-like helix-turn-helix DNA-binding protein n=1 Tax=Corynebacterium glyciniphilum TaxID=1404244 RepID=UPI00264DAC56|nr:sigma factor-like helix-turn-helix DNA-binding protein [Corynebacterium glyciniphilum]MDN5683939.1 hypothetical protein [Corynebacterium glyciniphilum]